MDNKSTAWVEALPEIALAMNLQTHSGTGKTPYEIMFNRSARWLDQLEHWNRTEVTEENIPDEVASENEAGCEQTGID